MNSIVENVESVARSVVEQQGMFLVDCVLRGKQNNRVLEVYVDSERGVTTELCAEISRQLLRELDRMDLITGNYTLVVSSPGVDRPLKFPMQYKKNIGREMEILLRDGDSTRTLKGVLVNCTDTTIEMQVGETSSSIPYGAIVRAKIVLPW